MERCELCGLPLASEHAHLFARQERTLVCACESCATLFDLIATQRYRRIRSTVRRLPDMTVSHEAWAALGMPVGLAFLSRGPSGTVVAAYPGPAGATTAIVNPDAWERLAARYPVLQTLEPDVEALLVNRLPSEPLHYRVSIDYCYRLAGLVRTRWSGVSGGPEVAAAIDDFFRALEEQAA